MLPTAILCCVNRWLLQNDLRLSGTLKIDLESSLHSNERMRPPSSLTIVLAIFLSASVLFWVSTAKQSRTKPSKEVSLPSELPVIPDILDQDRQFLRAEFPGFVLPLEQSRSTEKAGLQLRRRYLAEHRTGLEGSMESVSLVLERERATQTEYSEALQAAAAANQVEVCRDLLNRGAHPDAEVNPHISRPLASAMFHRNRELFVLLVEAGATKLYPLQRNPEKEGYTSFEHYAHPFYHAALAGDTDFCEFLLHQFQPEDLWQPILRGPYEYDNDIEYFNQGNTPLFAAVFGGHAETLQLLLRFGALRDENGQPHVDVNATNNCGATALHQAVNYGAARCAQLLLAAGADPTIPMTGWNPGNTPLHIANYEPLAPHMHSASGPISEDTFPLLIAACQRLGGLRWHSMTNGKGQTPLHLHAKFGNEEICRQLIRWGADVNAEADGMTPLAMAISYPHLPPFDRLGAGEEVRRARSRFCKMLVEAGAVCRGKCQRYQRRYYELAYEHGLFDFCDFLLAQGVQQDLNSFGGVYLFSATRHGRRELLENLLAQGADPNGENSRGRTSLHIAASQLREEFVERLLAAGADPNCQNEDGATPLFAVFNRFRNHMRRFSSSEAEANALEILKLLLDAGADPSIETRDGKRVLHQYFQMPSAFRDLIEAKLPPALHLDPTQSETPAESSSRVRFLGAQRCLALFRGKWGQARGVAVSCCSHVV